MKKNLIVKKMTTLALATAIATSPVSAFARTELEGHWAEATLTKWLNAGLLSGFADGTVKPDDTVTRAQFVTMIQNAMGLSTTGSANFTDVNSGDWFYGAVSTAVAHGIASGFPDGSFLPNAPVTRAQAAVFGANVVGSTTGVSVVNYTDANEIPTWAVEAVGEMTAKGFLSGMPDGSFNPNAYLTRAQAVSFLDRVREGVTSNTTSSNTSTDSTDDWTETEVEVEEDSTTTTSTSTSTSTSTDTDTDSDTDSSYSSGTGNAGSANGTTTTTTPEAQPEAQPETETETEPEPEPEIISTGVTTLADLQDALAGTSVGNDEDGYTYHADDDYIIIETTFTESTETILTVSTDTIIYVQDGANISKLTFDVDGADADLEIYNYDELATEPTAMAVFSLISSEAPVLGGLTITSGNRAVATVDISEVTVSGSIGTLTVANVETLTLGDFTDPDAEVVEVESLVATGTIGEITVYPNGQVAELEVVDVTEKLVIDGTVENVVATGTVEKIEIYGEITVLEVADVTDTVDIMGTVETIVATGTVEEIIVFGEGNGGEISSVVADGGIIKSLSISAIESFGGDILVDSESSENLDSSDSADVFVYLLEENTGEIHFVSTTVNVAVSSTNAEITVPSAALGEGEVVKIDLVGDDTVVEIIAQSNVEITSADDAVVTKITTSCDSIAVDVPVTEAIIATNCNEATIILGENGSTPTITVGDSVVILTVDLTETSPSALDQIDVTTTTTTTVEVQVATKEDVASTTDDTDSDYEANKIIVTKPDSVESTLTATVTTEDTSATEEEKEATIAPLARISTPEITSTTTVGTETDATILPFGTTSATVTMASASENVTIYYTTDASVDLSDDATAGTLATGTITISELVTGDNVVYAIAVDDGTGTGDASRLDSAIGTLTFTVEEADYDALDDAIADATTITATANEIDFDITADVWSELKTALSMAESAKTTGFTTQTAIDEMAVALKNAITNVDSAKLDRTSLLSAIESAEAVNLGLYDQSNTAVATFATALEDAQELLTITTTQATIGTATTTLTDAITALSTGALLDRTALDTAISTVETWITTNSAKYAKESTIWGEFESIIALAEELADTDTLTTQSEIDSTVALFTDIADKLTGALLSYSNLSDMIDSADEIVLDDATYTDATAKATFSATLEKAKALLDTLDKIFAGTSTTEVTQAEINAMADALAVAITDLDSSKLNITALETAIDSATELTGVNYKYDPTNDSWLTLVKALATAEGIVANIENETSDYIQTEINTATSDLTSAVDGIDEALLDGDALTTTIATATEDVAKTSNATLKANLETAIADGEALLDIIGGTGAEDARTTQSTIDTAVATLESIMDDIDNASVTITSAVENEDGDKVTVTFTATAGESVKFYVADSSTTPETSAFTGDGVEATGNSQTTEIAITGTAECVFALIDSTKITDAVAIEAYATLTNLIVGSMKIVAVDGTDLSEIEFATDTDKDANGAYTGSGDTSTEQNAEMNNNDNPEVDGDYNVDAEDPSADVKGNTYDDADGVVYVTTASTGNTLGYEIELYNTDGVLIPTSTTFDYFGTITDFYDQISWQLTENDGSAMSITGADADGFAQGATVEVTTSKTGTANLVVNFVNWTGVQGGTLSECVEITVS